MSLEQERYSSAHHTVAAFDAVAITKSDTTIFRTTRALYVGGAGTIVVTMNSGQEATFAGVLAGTILPIQVIQVKDATSATSLLALY
jgi:hypothetical protein